MTDFPDIPAPRAPWLVTLTDLALLLLGFMTLVHAVDAPRRQELAGSMRAAFGAEPPLPVAAFAVRFAAGSAALGDQSALIAWAKAETRDPRVSLTVTGATDGGPADIDRPTGSPVLLAADRARAVAAALAGVVPPGRLRLLTDPAARGRVATVTLAFSDGQP